LILEGRMSSFREFLVAHGIAERTAGDYVSRCRRIERELKVSLDSETRTISSFVRLIKRIRFLYRPAESEGFAAGSVASQLTGAVRRYAEFRWGKRVTNRYPLAYGGRYER